MAQTAAVPPDASIWRDVDARPPSTSERRLLAALGTAVAEPLLDQQLVTVLVEGVCRCGCASVRLRTREPAVPAARVARLSGTGRDDHLAVASTARTPGGHDVDVVLHVVHGRVPLDTADRPWGRDDEFSLRWILLHLVEEYARHNGHADLLREAVDGATGE